MRKLLKTGGLLLLSALILLSCGQPSGKKKSPSPRPAGREFPMVQPPSALTDPDERVAWLSVHFWDAFLDTTAVWPSSGNRVNGVERLVLEQQMGNYSYLLLMTSLSKARAALFSLYGDLAAFQRNDPDGPLFGEMVKLLDHYLYDPNSPVRDEDIFQPFAACLAESSFVSAEQQSHYAFVARMSALNAVGTRAADFRFVDTAGRPRTLYGIRAEHVLLIFGNPGCDACKELMLNLSEDPYILAQIRSGSLKVVDVYIDEEIDAWKAEASTYPAEWINGYDPDGRIRADLTYHVRALPSLYLLDRDKTVIFKDSPQEKILSYLSNQ